MTVLASYSFNVRNGRGGIYFPDGGLENMVDFLRLKEVTKKLISVPDILVEIDLEFLVKFFACFSNQMRCESPVELNKKVWRRLEND